MGGLASKGWALFPIALDETEDSGYRLKLILLRLNHESHFHSRLHRGARRAQ
jgi:hypothetical protein